MTRGFIREAVVAAKAATVREMLEGIRTALTAWVEEHPERVETSF